MHVCMHAYVVAHTHAGLQSLEKKRESVHSETMLSGKFETQKVTSAEFSMTLRFIQSGWALQMLRVLSKLCDEPSCIKINNWLVFNARSSECLQLCYLVLSMLTAPPKFAAIVDQKHESQDSTTTIDSTARAHHKRENRIGGYAYVHIC